MSDTAHSTTRQTLPGTVATRTASRGRPQRRPSISSTNTRDGYERSGAPGSTAYDLPEPNAMAELELSRSLSGCRRLNRSAAGYEQAGTTANSSAAAGERKRRRMTLKGREHTEKHGHLGEEDEEARVDDELATHGPAANETEEQKAERMYARFSERRKNVIVAIVAYAALLAREHVGMVAWLRAAEPYFFQPSRAHRFCLRFHKSPSTSTRLQQSSTSRSPFTFSSSSVTRAREKAVLSLELTISSRAGHRSSRMGAICRHM